MLEHAHIDTRKCGLCIAHILKGSKHKLQFYCKSDGSLALSSFLQEDQSKLSDQQAGVKRGQNPYPIYAAVNVRPNVSGEDFAGMLKAGLCLSHKICKWAGFSSHCMGVADPAYSHVRHK